MRRHSATLDPDALNFIELSKNSTDRMGRQIDDLLSYSKLGRNLPKPASVDINNMIAAIKMELGEKIREKNALVITQQLLPTLRNVHSSMIHHVFQNLIANGIKFNTNDKPEVCITYAESPESYTFCVNDNGIGIDDHSKVKLFQMFKRLHSDSEFEGTGIGLAVCKKIVEFYGGTIWLESEKGKGTAFYFTLPRLNMGHAQIYNAKLPGITLSQFASAS
jgi:light-regulated signal transduction histidine kinase (bacteriophytochrome)